MSSYRIITDDGAMPDASVYLSTELYGRRLLSPHLAFSEVECGGELLIAAKLVETFERVREKWGESIKVNSGYRTAEYQRRLKERLEAEGKKGVAAERSPHTEGMALDLNCRDKADVMKLLDTIRVVNADIGGFLRIGWRQYLACGMHFIHMDVCPFFFGQTGAWKERKVPDAFRIPGLEW